MKRLGFLLLPSLVALAIIGIVLGVNPADAVNTNADYSGTPPFIASVVTPNVLIMLDNSGSMGYRAVCDNTTNNFNSISSIKKGGSGNLTATVTYASGHGWTAADFAVPGFAITVSGVTTSTASNANYNGTFTVAANSLTWLTSKTISYKMAAAPYSSTAPGNPFVVDASGGLRNGLPAPSVYGNCPTATALYGLGQPDGALFREAITFTGMYDSLSCYTYSTANTRFDVTSTKAAISSACGATEWDGNLLNWATFRRQDALKKALMGGECVVARAADATCPPSGSPALITLNGAAGSLSGCCDDESTALVPLGAGTNNANGRVPTAVQTLVSAAAGSPTALVIHLMATTAMTSGGFCVGADNANIPSTSATSCGIVPASGGATMAANGEFMIHVSAAVEPTGVIQDLGDKARFGLLEFRNSGDGGKVLVPLGSNQAVPYNSSTITNYNSNKAAMIAAIEGTFAATSTPLSETLYTGMKYIAQLTQPFGTTSYLYPIAFSSSGGPALAASSTQGGIGSTESNLLASGDACTTATPAYISGACARDPYYFGTNPAWSSVGNPKQVPCCKTFIMFLTDGEPTADDNSELDRFIYPAATATAIHGVDCTGDYKGSPASLTSSAADMATYVATAGCFTAVSVDPNNTGATNTIAPATLLKKHKNDIGRNHFLDEISYWGHTTDLRQATITYPNGTTTESGHDLTGFQNVTIYPVFAFGAISGRDILMDAAKNGGFEDSNGNNLPDLQSEWDKVDNVTGLLVPDGQPDTYFESQNANDMKDKLLAALTSILQKAASGTSVSVLATSSTGEGAIYQAFFFPVTFVTIGSVTNQVAWTGFTQGLFIDSFGNLREDYSATGCTGLPDGRLVLIHDCIIKIRLDTNTLSSTFGQVLVDRFVDANGDGVADSTTPTATIPLTTNGVSNIQPIWEAGRQLALLDPGTSCESQATGWPKATILTQSGRTCRRILTWADLSNGGGVSSNEQLEVSVANVAALCPYLGGALVADCNSATPANQTAAQNEATGIINFVRGCAPAATYGSTVCAEQASLRNRVFNVLDAGGAQVQKVWKLGDIISSTPVIVGAPAERYDVIYGDATYTSYFQRYKDRRQVSYVGANDGMLHAFNAGYFESGDVTTTAETEQIRFTTTPKQSGTVTDCLALPCDGSVTTYAFRSDAPPLGAELWAFVPQDLLPQLRWMTTANYDHIYYVDLKPKVTDARIFSADADHPGGWGTILIGGFRLGGSCANCNAGKGTPRVVQADFDGNGTITGSTSGSVAGSDYREFLSSYFVLDITNPEKEPDLLWTFRDKNLGLTTSAPAVIRVNPSADAKTSSTHEKWYAVFGSGPTHHDGFACTYKDCTTTAGGASNAGQNAQVYVVDLKAGPSYSQINDTTSSGCTTALPCNAANTTVGGGAVRAFSTGTTGAFMGDPVTTDYNLDFRMDTAYVGYALCNGTTSSATSGGCDGANPTWKGAMWRLTTNNGDTNPDHWGLSAGCSGSTNCPAKLTSTFAYSTSQATTCSSATPCNVGPVLAAPSLSVDDTNNLWVFFGTGRYFNNADKTNTDIQHFFGVKDSFISAGTPAQTTERNNLYNSSNIIVCTSCAAGANVSTNGGTTASDFTTSLAQGSSSLISQILSMDGWFTTFSNPPAPLTPGERNLSASTLIGGTLFFPSFTPTADICQSSGTGNLYAVFYQTGGPYQDSSIGTTTASGNTLASKSISLGQGLPSQMAIQIGSQGSGTSGAASSSGCAGRITGFIQASTGVLGQVCGTSAFQSWSKMVAWRDL